MLTVAEAAKRLGVSNETLYNWHKAGKLEIIFKDGKKRYIKLEDVERIESNKLPPGKKKCTTCGHVDDYVNFIGGHSKCDECYKQRNKLYRENNKEAISQRRKDKYKENPIPYIERAKRNYQKDPEAGRQRALEYYYDNKECLNISRRLKNYNLSEEQYIELKEKNNGLCEICGEVPAKECIDHDHDTGHVRGILCTNCNTGLGMLGDDISVLQSAIDYLRAQQNTDTTEEAISVYYYGAKKGVLPGLI